MATQPFHCLPSHTISNVLSRHEAIVSGCVYTSGISSLLILANSVSQGTDGVMCCYGSDLLYSAEGCIILYARFSHVSLYTNEVLDTFVLSSKRTHTVVIIL